MEFGFTPEGEKLAPHEELTHALETYGSENAMPEDLKNKLIEDFGSVEEFEKAVESHSAEDVQDIANAT
ncbi:MAG: hypothetical protein H8D63_02160 [Parcubacteria group bacterium]|nr:hypothetical protein [Parcubacteria group bacterium]